MPDKSLADLRALFEIEKKSKLKQHCRTATITQADLAGLILACMSSASPLNHRAHHREFIPDHLVPTPDDLSAFATNGVGPINPRARRTASKLSTLFDERRLLSGHLFFSSDLSNWHFFYFDQRDFTNRNNHWDGGSHIHFINHLWPDRTAQSVWDEFRAGNPQMRGAMHIRFSRER